MSLQKINVIQRKAEKMRDKKVRRHAKKIDSACSAVHKLKLEQDKKICVALEQR